MHYLIWWLGPRCGSNFFLSRPIWVDFCSRLWSCLHSSRSVRWNNAVLVLPNYLSRRLGLCVTTGIVCGLDLGYSSWPCILVWCAGLCLCLWVNGLQGVSRVKLIWDSNYKPTRSWLFDFIWILWNAECEKTLRCNLWNVPQAKFRIIHLFKFLHSAFRKVHLPLWVMFRDHVQGFMLMVMLWLGLDWFLN